MRPFVLNQRHLRLASALALATILATLPGSAVARTACTYSFGFATLHAQIPDIVGVCVDAEQIDPTTGNITQRTEKGVLTWRKGDNWTAFSDGPNTYILGPNGVATRPTAGPPFPWEPASVANVPAGQPATVPVGSVLFAESFDDPASPTCQRVAAITWTGFEGVCAEGALSLRGTVDASHGIPIAMPGVFGNASMVTDMRLIGGAEQRSLSLACRRAATDQLTGYFLYLVPSLQRFALGIMRENRWEPVVPWTESPAINRGDATNRVELACTGDTITGWINGVEVGSFRDETYRSGRFVVNIWNDAALPLPVDARFDNLVIRER